MDSGVTSHVGIEVPDLEVARNFYCGIVGFEEAWEIEFEGPVLERLSGIPDDPWGLTLELLGPTLRSIVVLGAFGWQALLPVLGAAGWSIPRPRPSFGHGVTVTLHSGEHRLQLIGSYHVSQQNTFTGRLTPAMLDEVLIRAKTLAGLG